MTELDLSRLDLSHVASARGMFSDCSGVKSLDVSSMREVTGLEFMFDGCESLVSVRLPERNDAQVWDMLAMFKGCRSLRAVDLSGFDTSRVTSLAGLFEGCESLRAVDLSCLDLRAVIRMEGAFKGCRSLETVDLRCAFPSMFERTDPANYQLIRPTQDVFTGCVSIRSWKVSKSWICTYRGSIPEPTNDRGAWWSERAGAWLTPQEIAQRGRVADCFGV